MYIPRQYLFRAQPRFRHRFASRNVFGKGCVQMVPLCSTVWRANGAVVFETVVWKWCQTKAGHTRRDAIARQHKRQRQGEEAISLSRLVAQSAVADTQIYQQYIYIGDSALMQ